MAKVTGASLQPIYDRLNGMDRFHPMEANTFADWSVEAGDVVQMSSEGTKYKSPVHTSTMTWKGGAPQVAVNSTGNEKRDSVSKTGRKKDYGGGGGAMRNQQGLYSDVYSEDGYLSSVIAQSERGIVAYVNDTYNQLQAGIRLTASSLKLYVDNSYKNMRSGLTATASSLKIYVDNSYDRMSAGLNVTSSSIVSYVTGPDGVAAIVQEVNKAGSRVTISANKIMLDGGLTVNDVMKVTDRTVYIKTPMRVEGDIMTSSVTLRNGSDSLKLNEQNMITAIKSASVKDNTLTLTTFGGTKINFSKATQLSASWDGNRKFTVSASPQGVTRYTTLNSAVPQADQEWNGRTGTLTLRATIDGGETTVQAGKVTLTAPEQYPNSMSITRSKAGRTATGMDIFYGKLYYWDEDSGDYEPATTGSHYWYYSNTDKSGTTTVHY